MRNSSAGRGVCCLELMTVWWNLLLVILCYRGQVSAQLGPDSNVGLSTVQLSLSNHPGRVYSGAPPGLVVLQVFGVNSITDEPVIRFDLTNSQEYSEHFKIDSTGYIRTAKDINFGVGKKLELVVEGRSGDGVGHKFIEIYVSEKNLYPPVFQDPSPTFEIYGRDVGQSIGSVRFTDEDNEKYNKESRLRLMETMASTLDYVELSDGGILTLKREVPSTYDHLMFQIEAINTGSPRKTATAQVQINILTIKQPDTFCFSTTKDSITLCWKNPMPDRTFQGYFLQYEDTDKGDGYTYAGDIPLPWIRDHKETCYTTKGTKLDYMYTFSVKIATNENIGDSHVQQISFKNTAAGYSQECSNQGFSLCNYVDPCSGHGNCMQDESGLPDKYTCQCDPGWKGENCSLKNECADDPCLNGECEFQGHEEFLCKCQTGYFGDKCEHYNHCLTSPTPCQNGAECLTHSNGFYSCNCLIGFSGQFCEVKDPCRTYSCVVGRGTCVRTSDITYKCDCEAGYYGQHCELTDACVLNNQPCRNQGTCLTKGRDYDCLCTNDYMGRNCETVNFCALNPCRNGVCSMNPTTGSYLCTCHDGYEGNECQHLIDPCRNRNCNSGQCKIGEDNLPRCLCSHGYYGEYCEFDPCSSNPCGAHGVCSIYVTNGSYHCDCNEGFEGDQCQIRIEPCRMFDCNHGRCVRDSNFEPRCECWRGYFGTNCELDQCFHKPCGDHGVCSIHATTGAYICTCEKGFEGKQCQTPIDPCKNMNCIYGTCEIDSNLAPSCTCSPGYYGVRCTELDPCYHQKPCVHGSCSNLHTAGSYYCSCHTGYMGINCDMPTDLCWNVNCNFGTCETGPDFKPRCVCYLGYVGLDCNTKDPCSSNPCQSEGQCNKVDDSTYKCTCVPGWVGSNCQVYNPCVIEPSVCSEFETCLLHPENEWIFGQASYTCKQEQLVFSDPTHELSNMTKDPTQVTSEIFENVTRKLLEIYDTALVEPQVAENSVEVINNLAHVNLSVSEETSHLSKQLREFLDNYTLHVDLDSGGEMNISTSGIELKSMFVRDSGNRNDTFTFSPQIGDSNQTAILIQLPAEVLEGGPETKNTRLRFVAYDRSQLFVPGGGFWEDYRDGLLSRQKVISASVGDRPVVNLSSPVVIHLIKIRNDINHTCAYWDEAANEWSDVGVKHVEENESVVVCHSDHLTNFAVLMAPTTEALPAGHAEALATITWAGCAISMACLFLTILTYGLFRCLHGEKSGKTLLNLSSALLLLNVMFLVGTLDVNGFSRTSCVAVAMCVHYSLLASLMWMLVEAVDMYRALVTVFNKYENFYLIKRCVAAWGIPLLVVIITAAIDTNNYFTESTERKEKGVTKVCLMTAANTPAYYVTILAPGCLIVAINTVVFILVARVILKPKFQHQKSNKEADSTITVAQVRGAFMVMILLGVTWLFGPLAIDDARLVFSYLFCICNSLQGCLIFFFRCLLNPEAQLAWKQLFTTGTLKRRRGPIRSAYTDSSSKSFAGTNPKYAVTLGAGDTKEGRGGGGKSGVKSVSYAADEGNGGDGLSQDGKSSKHNEKARDSVSTLCTTVTSGSFSEKGRKSSIPIKSPKVYHAHPHQLHSTSGGMWHPNLNGLPRDSPSSGFGITVPSATDSPSVATDPESLDGSSECIDSKNTDESMTQF